MNFSEDFKNGESLLRGISKNPDCWKNDADRPSSAAFKDSNGLSVNRTGENRKNYDESFELLKTTEIKGETFRAISEVSLEFCVELGVYLKYSPLDNNIYHSEIHKSQTVALLTKSIARKLSENCMTIKI